MPDNTVLTNQRIQTLYTEEFAPKVEAGGEWADWLQEYTKTLDAVKAEGADLASPELQQILWEDNGVSGAGMCSVQLAPAIAEESFRSAVSAALASDLPADIPSREQRLQAVHAMLQNECGPMSCTSCDCGRHVSDISHPSFVPFRAFRGFLPAPDVFRRREGEG